jgi:hypothetical protein
MMGCDIHAFVEYVDFVTHDGKDYWKCLIGNAGSRDYRFFSLLANCGRGSRDPVFPNRGFPDGEVSHEVFRSEHICASDEYKDEEGYCSTASADSWVASHSSKNVYRGEEPHRLRYVTSPDNHSHSWLTCDELGQVIATYITEVTDGPYDAEWDAIWAAMRALEAAGKRTRLTFWFDN